MPSDSRCERVHVYACVSAFVYFSSFSHSSTHIRSALVLMQSDTWNAANWKAFWHLISPDSKYIFQCFASTVQLINTKTKTFPANKVADIDGSTARCFYMVTEHVMAYYYFKPWNTQNIMFLTLRDEGYLNTKHQLLSAFKNKRVLISTRHIIYYLLNNSEHFKWHNKKEVTVLVFNSSPVTSHQQVVSFSCLTRFVNHNRSTLSRYGTDTMMATGVKSTTGTFIVWTAEKDTIAGE